MKKAQQKLPIVDSFGRVHDSLRVSVTDRCNIRCFYCMPEVVRFLPQHQILTFEEIHRIVQITAGMGVRKIRLTGGEPLVRSQLWKLDRDTGVGRWNRRCCVDYQWFIVGGTGSAT